MPELTAKTKRVPWKTTADWLDVKNKVISQDHDDLVRGYELMLMWKARCPNLPVHVECTLGLLQVLVKGEDSDSSTRTLFNKDENLQLCYSTALLRFVNHVSASTSPLGDTLYLVAHKQNIPDWVVNLRHDIAHSATLPSLSLLKAAILLGKQWLVENYWEPVKKDLMGVDGSSMNIMPSASTGFVHTILKEAIKVWWICRHKNLIAELTESEWLMLLNVCERFSDYKLIKYERVVNNLQKLIVPCKEEQVNFRGKKILLIKVAKNILTILKILYNQESKKLNKYFLEGLVEVGFLKSAGSNLKEWEPLLKVLHNVDSLQVLLEFLFEKLNGASVEDARHAEGWVQALAPCLNHLYFRWNLMEKEINEKIPDSDECNIVLSLRQPPSFKFETLRPCLMNPTSLSYSIFTSYIKFTNPTLPEHARSVITDLLKLYSNEPSDEIPLYPEEISDVQLFSVKDFELNIPTLNLNGRTNSENNGRWQKVKADPEVWRCCSIGILPNQVDPNFELPSIQWHQVKHNSRKRKAIDEL